jgi:translation initiation factor IF-1
MTFARQFVVVLVLALLAPLSFASEKSQHRLDIADPVQVGSTQLQPGHYKLEWRGNGPAVEVSFLQNGKTVAIVPGTLKMNDSKVTQDDIVTSKTSPNTSRLEEIDFLHQKEALIFGSGASSNQSR